MPKVTDAYREGRRDAIADAAVRVIERRGMGAASMTDVISESGLSAGAVYGHFPEKRDIFLHVVRRLLSTRKDNLKVFDGLLTKSEEAGSPLTPRQILSTFLAAVDRRLETQPTTLHLHLYSQAMVDDEFAAVVRGMGASMEQLFADHLYRGARAARLSHDDASDISRELVPVMVTVIQGYVFHSAIDPTEDRESLRARLSRTVPDGYIPVRQL